jgi:CheY-like chemotaxis protein
MPVDKPPGSGSPDSLHDPRSDPGKAGSGKEGSRVSDRLQPPSRSELSSGNRVRFQELTRHRVRRILLVSSLYDSFILAEDGQLNEAILGQYHALNLSTNPDLTRVTTGAEALELVDASSRVDLIITSMQVGDMDAVELARRVRALDADIPVILLAYSNRDLTDFRATRDTSVLDRIFLWQGDVGILLAMIKYVEDRLNVAFDTGVAGVPAIIVVEDNVRFYSSYLPVIYTELVDHMQGLMAEGLNLSQKTYRMRVRPKVLLCETFEEAWDYFSTYQEHILGVISDIEFPQDGKPHRRAGVELASRVREVRPDVPIMLQSSFPENDKLARKVNARFLLKGSPVLLHQLRDFIVENFGFGAFVFRLPDDTEIDRAEDLKSLVEKLHTVPAECLAFHGERNHFSIWLKARGEFALAQQLRPRKVADYQTLEDLRQNLIHSIEEYRRKGGRVTVADFDRERFDTFNRMSRIGGGSLGGKARGLAFVNRVLADSRVAEQFPSIQISVPFNVVLGTDVFDEFLELNDLQDLAIRATSDSEVEGRFLGVPFPWETVKDLEAFLEACGKPLAVRSSGLLEDSPHQPFAGVYQTYMLPNNDPDPQVRLNQLLTAVKRVYASTFSQRAKRFLDMTPYRLEEEKMAVIIQEVVGVRHGDRFYPDFSGVARSHDFYPTSPIRAEDGVVAVGLGLGEAVAGGEACLRFCPRYPRHLVTFSSVDDVLKNSQREFYALYLGDQHDSTRPEELGRYGLHFAEEDGTLAFVGSTYSPDNDVVYDGISRPGVRIVSFAPVLKHGRFPLAELIDELLRFGSEGTSSPVEIEFAVNLSVAEGSPPEFGFLQMRPLALTRELEELRIGHVLTSQLICRSAQVLGNGKLTDVKDLVVVDYHRFDRLKSLEVAEQVARINAELQSENVPYLLIGVGRWGSADQHLGIPVSWDQIAGARVIVEAGFKDFKVTPSQGTHFFQNITSCNVGYFTVNPQAGDGFVDWDWLAAQQAVRRTEFVSHIRLDAPAVVKMSGKSGEGVILKPEASKASNGGADT